MYIYLSIYLSIYLKIYLYDTSLVRTYIQMMAMERDRPRSQKTSKDWHVMSFFSGVNVSFLPLPGPSYEHPRDVKELISFELR